jgi:hypothetical protein
VTRSDGVRMSAIQSTLRFASKLKRQ